MRRIAELDGLRGLAALMVVAYHMFINRLPWGWAAVDVFFVLSGYLITGIVLEHGGAPGFLAAFYARRGLRIWPIYYLLIAVMACAWADDPRAIGYYVTYTQEVPRYWGAAMPFWAPMQHAWTLALEEQFYLVWPALVLFVGRRWTGPLALTVAAVSIAVRGLGGHYWLLAGRCDGFALGGFLAALLAGADAREAGRRALRWAALASVAALATTAALAARGRLIDAGGPAYFAWHITTASLGSFAVVALVVRGAGSARLAPLRWAPLVYLGTISYGLYLYHHPIVMSSFGLRRLLGVEPGPVLWATEALLTLAAAVVSWHLVEKRILLLKDLVPYRARATRVRDARPAEVVAA